MGLATTNSCAIATTVKVFQLAKRFMRFLRQTGIGKQHAASETVADAFSFRFQLGYGVEISVAAVCVSSNQPRC